MQWILQEYEDTSRLAEVLDRAGETYSLHKVVPFVGELDPEPNIVDPNVVMFGSYSLRHYARQHGLTPGVWELRPYLNEYAWQEYLLNGPHNTRKVLLKDLGGLPLDDTLYFIRPVEDSKEIAGTVMDVNEILYTVKSVMGLRPDEYIQGSLRPDTEMMLGTPVNIQAEWRNWIVGDELITSSLYKQGRKVLYREGIDDDAREFVKDMVACNPGYAGAYVLDVCRSDGQLYILETNCINAAGFYAADLNKLVGALA